MRNFFPRRKLAPTELSMVPEAFFQLLLARLKVSVLPSRLYLSPNSINPTPSISKGEIEKGNTIASVINGLSIRTPFSSTCLVKVLAAQKMLLKRKIPHSLHFGVHRNLSNGFKAHAWLSLAGEVIIGGDNLQDFQEISKS